MLNRISLVGCLLFALGLAPVRAGEELPPAPAVQLFVDSSHLYTCCRAVLACGELPELQEYAGILRRHCEERLADCRARLQSIPDDSREEEPLRSQMDQTLSACDAALRGHAHWDGADGERASCIADAQKVLLCAAPGEPYLSVPKARLRLHAARQALFSALGRAESRMRWDRSEKTRTQLLGELLPLYADFRCEMQIWGTRSLSEERRERWRREQLKGFNLCSVRYGEAAAWLTYLREDAEEAAAQYDKCWRRACRHAAADISATLSDTPEAPLPTFPAWLAGEAMEPGTAPEQAFFYRLRDAHAFCMLASPLARASRPEGESRMQSLHECALAELALNGEQYVLSPQLARLLPSRKGSSLEPSWPSFLGVSEDRALEELRARARLCPTAGMEPVGSSRTDHLNLRVEGEAAAMLQALDAAEKFVPHLREVPDASALRLLVQLADQWNAYTSALRFWGNTDRHRSFWWYGGCLGYHPVMIWEEGYYLPGINLCRTENDELIKVDQSNARTLMTALIGEMREQLEASLEEHRRATSECVSVLPPQNPPGTAALQLPLPSGAQLPSPGENEHWSLEMPLPDGLAPPAEGAQQE